MLVWCLSVCLSVCHTVWCRPTKRKLDLYSAPLWARLWSAQVYMDHTVVTLQTHHTCLYLVAFTRWRYHCSDSNHLISAYTTHLSTAGGWKAELAYLADLCRNNRALSYRTPLATCISPTNRYCFQWPSATHNPDFTWHRTSRGISATAELLVNSLAKGCRFCWKCDHVHKCANKLYFLNNILKLAAIKF